MSCYYYKELHSCSDPIFKNVDICIILVMENSKRFKQNHFLNTLCSKTVIQYNKGFKKCYKYHGIDNTTRDINHAYWSAFKYCENYDNVLILEEDAEPIYYDKHHYKKLDDYVKDNKDKLINLGVVCSLEKIDDSFLKCVSSYKLSAQANIYSKYIREILKKNIENDNFTGHYDEKYFKNLEVITYKHPLIGQLYPITENQKNWDSNFQLIRFSVKILDLDANINNWEAIYLLCKIRRDFFYPVIVITFLFILKILQNLTNIKIL